MPRWTKQDLSNWQMKHNAGLATKPTPAVACVKSGVKVNSLRTVMEAEIQTDIERYLLLKEIYYVRARMDRRTTTAVGTPDFLICYHGVFAGIECKRTGQLPTAEQLEAGAAVQKSGGYFAVVNSLEQAITFLNMIQI